SSFLLSLRQLEWGFSRILSMPNQQRDSQNYTIDELRDKLPEDIFQAVMSHLSVNAEIVNDMSKSVAFENLRASADSEETVHVSKYRLDDSPEEKVLDTTLYEGEDFE
ncbi:hypothetical protein, partial [Haloferax volcanii]|uniref:hypothetical protein n=1 Tax=Haloferax volcanii TaxID=2246 RepID=UPI00385EBA34